MEYKKTKTDIAESAKQANEKIKNGKPIDTEVDTADVNVNILLQNKR